MSGVALLAWILALPVISACAVVVTRARPNLRESLTVASGIVLFLLVVALYRSLDWDNPPRLVLAEPFPGLQLAFEPEPLGLLFAMVAGFLWPVTSVYAVGYMRAHHEQHQTRFFAAFAVSIGATMGIAFAANMFTLFVFYEILTVATYPLVTHAGTDEARRAGRVYLGILMGTSVSLLLLATVWTWQLTGTLEFTRGGVFDDQVDGVMLGVLLALYVFGTGKAALMPFHRWLPAAMVAPTPVSALLHAVAVVKAGVFTILKVVVYLFGIDVIADLMVADLLAALAALTILIASLVAMTRDNLKARLAYSTVSQLSYITLGMALATSMGVLGGGMHIAMHAMGKITLFMCAGSIYVATHKTEISQMTGLGRAMPVTFAAFLIGALSIIGLPPMGGSWSKWLLIMGAADTQHWIMIGVLMVSSLLNVAYLLPPVAKGFFLKGDEAHEGWAEAKPLVWLPPAITAAGCLVLFFYAGAIQDFLMPLVTD